MHHAHLCTTSRARVVRNSARFKKDDPCPATTCALPADGISHRFPRDGGAMVRNVVRNAVRNSSSVAFRSAKGRAASSRKHRRLGMIHLPKIAVDSYGRHRPLAGALSQSDPCASTICDKNVRGFADLRLPSSPQLTAVHYLPSLALVLSFSFRAHGKGHLWSIAGEQTRLVLRPIPGSWRGP